MFNKKMSKFNIFAGIGLIASMVFGLVFQSIQAAQMPLASVSLSNHTKSVSANHEYRLQTPSGVDASTDTITLDLSSWTVGSVTFADIDFYHGPVTGLENNNTLAASAAAGVWGASFSSGVLTLTPPTDAALGTIGTNDYLTIRIGTNASGGVNQLTNPASAGSYPITVGGGFGDTAYMAQAITNYNGVNVDATVASSLTITSINPSSVIENSGAFTMTITGTGFTTSSAGQIAGSNRPTVYASSTELAVSILASDILAAGTKQITVNNTPPGITSNQLPLTITSQGGGGPSQDTTPPTIINPQAINITQTGARIIWDTDESATSRVDYGLTNSYGETVSNSSLVLSHGLDISGLTASTTYHFRVQSADQYGNNAISADYTFTTLPWSPLEISNVTSTNIADTSAIIIWETNRAANSTVQYGTTPGLGMIADQSAYVSNHSTPLSSLTPDTDYFYRVISYDTNGIGATSTVYTFHTTSDQTPPTNITLTATPGDTLVNLEWTHPPEPDFTGVRLIRQLGDFPSGPFDGDLVYDGLATSTVDTGLINGTTYYYAAYPYDNNGNYASGALDSATPSGEPEPPPPIPTSTTTTPPIPPGPTPTTTPPTTTGPATTTEPGAGEELTINPLYYGANGSLLLEADDQGVRGVLPNESVLVRVPVSALGESADAATIQINGQTYSLQLNNDGTEFTGTFPAPSSGEFPAQVQVNFVSGATANSDDDFEVRGPGYVVEAELIPGVTPVPGATVTLYQVIDNEPVLWNGAPYGQSNPILSDQNGNFVFRVPNGDYFVEVGKVGYKMQKSPTFEVEQNVFGQRVELIYIPEPLVITTCQIDCSLVTYEVYIINPDGTKRFMNTEYAQADPQGDGVTLYRFEDKGDDFDYNDVLVQVDHSDCEHLKFAILKTNAGWHHEVRARIFYEGSFRRDVLIAGDSHAAYGQTITLNLTDDPSLCEIPEEELQIEVLPEQIEFTALTGIDIIREPEVVSMANNYMAPAVVGVSLLNLGAALSLFNVLAYLQFLFTQPILLFGRLRKRRWGVVYNSLTKQPVELAIVRLTHKQSGLTVQTKVTDKQGRYFFRVKKGDYLIEVVKPKYAFPSEHLANKNQDAVFANLYHGEAISLNQEGVIAVNIPIDPQVETSAPRKVIYKRFIKRLQHFIAIASIIFALLAFIIAPSWFIGIILFVQVGFYFLFRQLALPAKSPSWGRVLDAGNKKPVQNAIVRIFDKQFNKLLDTQVTGRDGKYGFFVEHNIYYITVEKPDYQKYTSKDLDLGSQKDTIIDLDIKLKRDSAPKE